MKKIGFALLVFSIICLMPKVALAATDNAVGVSYQSHVQNLGWMDWVQDGQASGTTGEGLRMECIKVNLTNPVSGMRIKYQVHIQNIGWQDWVYDGQPAGTTGQSLRIEAIRIILEGAPEGYHVEYQAHVENIGWQDWVRDGQIAGTTGMGLRLEAIKIRITSDISQKTIVIDPGHGGTEPGAVSALPINYQAHMQNIGWQNCVTNEITPDQDGISEYIYIPIGGLPNQGLRMEALKISLGKTIPGVRLKYQAHVQNIGWQDWVYDGQMAGTTGQSLRIEGIKMMLEGAPEGYHIKYQAYVQGQGWQNWVQDGQLAGTVGQSLSIQAIKISIIIVEKELNNALSEKIGNDLTSLGANVLYTRDPNDDTTVSLSQRTTFANNANADLFLSIHHDASPSITNRTPSGVSTYYSSYRPGVETDGVYVMYNGQRYTYISEGNGGFYVKDSSGNTIFLSNEYAIAYDGSPCAAATKSAQLSQQTVNLLSGLGFNNRGSSDQNLYVTRWTDMPSMLIEAGFVTNPDEAIRIADPSIQQQMADKIVQAIVECLR